MSDLRNHLEAAKREYLAARYPGDLARDAMPVIGASSRMRIFVRCASAMAAVIAIVLIGRIMLRSTSTPPTITVNESSHPAVATTDADEQTVSVSMTSVAAPSWSDIYSAGNNSAGNYSAGNNSVDQADSSTVAENPSWPATPSFPSMDQIDESTVGQTLDQSLNNPLNNPLNNQENE
jgi:hypothetical protein